VEETSEVIDSQFYLSGVVLDGDQRAAFGLKIRFRHNSTLDSVYVQGCETGVWEKDTWLSRRSNCRVVNCGTGWHLVGSNHSSQFDRITFTQCSAMHLLIENGGSAGDANVGLAFNSCDLEFGSAAGKGLVLKENVQVSWNDGYLGENIDGVIIENLGGRLTVSGGVAFFGYTQSSYLVAPIGGETIFANGVRLAGQAFGSTSYISLLADGQVPAAGTIRFDDVNAFIVVGGDVSLKGDILGYGDQRQVFVPRLGREYIQLSFSTTITVTNPTVNAKRVTCNSVTGTNPIIGLGAQIVSSSWRQGEPLYLVVTYLASKPVWVRIDQGALGAPAQEFGFAPAKSVVSTYIKLDTLAPAVAAGLWLDFALSSAQVGDYLEVREVFLTDSTMHAKGIGVASRLFKC
jgi:hypothetical protein